MILEIVLSMLITITTLMIIVITITAAAINQPKKLYQIDPQWHCS